jgi:hypothetical protein
VVAVVGFAGRVEAVMDDAQHAEEQLDYEDGPAEEGAGEEEGVHLRGKMLRWDWRRQNTSFRLKRELQ